MPRRRIPINPLPRRLDRRRPRGNATDAQRRPHHARRGQVEAIAERRALALELRKAGAPYREIARQLGIDVHTAHADVGAELAALRETTVGRAEDLRALELERYDRMVAGLWPQIEKGNPPAVTAAVRVSERRARLLGLDEPVVTKNEVTAALSVTAQKYAAERELFLKLDVHELEELAAESQALVDKALGMARAHGARLDAATARCAPMERRDGRDTSGPKTIGADVVRLSDGDRVVDLDRAQASALPVGVLTSPAAAVEDVVTGEPAEQSTVAAVADERGSRAETDPEDTPR